MRAFRLEIDRENFGELRFKQPEKLAELCKDAIPFCGRKIGCDAWRSSMLEATIVRSSMRLGDFAYIADGAMAVRQKAVWELPYTIGYAGESFPILVNQEQWYVINVTNICNCLDKEEAKFRLRSDGTFAVDEYVVLGTRFDQNVFKIPETASEDIFTYSGFHKDPEYEFISAYHNKNYTGLKFEEIRISKTRTGTTNA